MGEWMGPYRGASESPNDDVREFAIRMAHAHNDNNHPTPWTDVPDGINRDEHCVFSDVDRINDWFQNFGHGLEDVGFMVVGYEVDESDVRMGNRQDVAVISDDKIVSIESPLGYIH